MCVCHTISFLISQKVDNSKNFVHHIIQILIDTFFYLTISICAFRFFYTYYQSGRWIYGIFYVLNWNERILLMAFNYFAAILVMKFGIMLQDKKQETNPLEHRFKLE